MAPARRTAAHLLLVCAGLLTTAVGLAFPEPRARREPPGNELPAGPGESPAGLAARPREPDAPTRADPRDAWMLFVRQNDKGADGKTGGRGGAKKPKLGRPGPPGPPGPQGPPGPAIPLEVLLKEVELLLRGAVRQRERAEPEPCTRGPGPGPAAAREDEEAAGVPAAPLAPGPRAPRIEAAFHCRLRRDASVERRTLHELGGYYQPDAQGAFRRGPGLNLTSGQYTAPIAGFYALAATLHVGLREPPRRGTTWPRGRLRLLVCIQSRCQSLPSLEAAVGLEGGGDLFSVSVSGVLHLQAGQYASVFLDNASSCPLSVRGGSCFSAILLGV